MNYTCIDYAVDGAIATVTLRAAVFTGRGRAYCAGADLSAGTGIFERESTSDFRMARDEACSSWFLPRIVGISQAAEWVYSGRIFPADEALAAGLVRSVHPAGELLPAACALAWELTESSAPRSKPDR